jgi:purine-nucleoside phosphorylase
MSIHIGAAKDDIAETVLLPGDPLRARYVAENFLEKPVCYNQVRGMLGFTGGYKGRRISVQGTGMGQPSLGIYVHELINFYGARRLVRIGSCGSLRKELGLRSLVLAQAASTNSSLNRMRFHGMDYAPAADFDLLLALQRSAQALGLPVAVGSVLSSDAFYDDDAEAWKLWAAYGTLAVEMESSNLYTIAAKFGVKAASILTVSDNLVTRAELTSAERQASFSDMVRIALEAL